MLHIETIAIFTSFLEIVAILVYEFVVPISNADFTIFTVQILVLTFFFYKLVKTYLETSGNSNRYHYSKRLILFYAVMAVAIAANWIVGIVNGHTFTCATLRYEPSWFVMLGIYCAVCTLNMVMGNFIIAFRLKGETSEFEVSAEHTEKRRKQLQTLIWGNFLTAFSLLAWVLLSHSVTNNTNISCKKFYWMPCDNLSGAFLAVKSVLTMTPAILFWLTFYHYRTGNI